MALKIADRVKETTTTTGTGTISLAGAMTGFQAFSAACADQDTCWYALQAVDANGSPTGDWETGYGTFTASGNTLARTTIFASSNSGAAVNLSSGTKQIWITLPAARIYEGAGWAKYLCAALEPDAIEAIQMDSFTYTVSSSATKLLMASWQTRLSSTGRMETRNPQRWLPIRGVTLTGTASLSSAMLIDPTKPTYTDPWGTYYSRLQTLAESQTRYVATTASSTLFPFLPGPYGAIITQVTSFDFTWTILNTYNTYGFNLWDEINDSNNQRVGDTLMFPVSKSMAGPIKTGAGAAGAAGSISFVLLPSTWSAVADSISSSYSFRDDFMGSSLDTTSTWNRTQSTAGNVEIDTTYQWCKWFGNSNWGTNAIYTKTFNKARSSAPTFVIDVYTDAAAQGMVGWGDGGGYNYTNFAHAVNIAPSNALNVYENGNARGTVGSGWSAYTIYRIKIVANTGGSASYYIQGGTQYPQIGSTSWTNITPGTTSSSTNTLYPMASPYSGSGYISDIRVI